MIDNQGLIKGKSLGESIIHVAIKHPDETITVVEDGLHLRLNVIIKFKSFNIKCPTSIITQHQSIIARIEGGYNEKPDHLSFKSVEVKWKSNSLSFQILPNLSNLNEEGKHIEKYYPLSISNKPDIDIYGSSVHIHATLPGKYTIFADIKVTRPDNQIQIKNQYKYIQPKITYFKEKYEIIVLEPLELLSSNDLLLTYGVSSRIRTTLDDNDHIELKYQVLSQSNHANLIKVNDKGIIFVSKIDDDKESILNEAVILVSTDTLNPQVVSIRISVRPIAQLHVIPLSPYLQGPLCVGQNITAKVIVLDSLGRLFNDVDGSKSTGLSSSLKVISNDISVLRVTKYNHETFIASSSNITSNEEEEDVVSYISFTALSTEGLKDNWYISTTATISLDNIPPIYLNFDITEQCIKPAIARISLQLNDFDDFDIPLYSIRRNDFINQFKLDIFNSLDNLDNIDLIHLYSINITNYEIIFDILPSYYDVNLKLHKDQWHLSNKA